MSSDWTPLTPGVSQAAVGATPACCGRMFWKRATTADVTNANSGVQIAVSVPSGSWIVHMVEYSGGGISLAPLAGAAAIQLTPSGSVITSPTVSVTTGIPAIAVCFAGVAGFASYSSEKFNGSATGVTVEDSPLTFSASTVLFDLLVASTIASYAGSATLSSHPGLAAIAVFGQAGPTYTDGGSGEVILSGSGVESGTGAKLFIETRTGKLVLSGAATSVPTYADTGKGTLVLSGTATEQETRRRVLLIRERPPMRLHAIVQTPAGRVQRWGDHDQDPANALGGLSMSSTMPGGFEQAAVTLTRKPTIDYPDLEELSTVTFRGVGGRIAGQYRIETAPRTSGDQVAITPGLVGWQSHLDDNSDAREIYVDRDLNNWQGPSVQRQIQWLLAPGGAPVMANGPNVTPDYTTGFPSLDLELTGPWSEDQVVEGWYDAHAIPLSTMYAAWKQNGAIVPDGFWGWGIFLLDDDTGTVYDKGGNYTSSPGQAFLHATSSTRKWALVQLFNDEAPGGQSGVTYDLFFTALAVYGRHGLTLQGPADATDAPGVLASDVIAHAIGKWAPKLSFSTGPNGTIQPSDFIIPHLIFVTPSKTSDIIKEVTKYQLQDWGVWEGPTFFWYPRGTMGRRWRARIGPAKLTEAGPQISRLWNSVVVQYTDVTGANRTAGPPGSGSDTEDPSLFDSDPLNPANQAGIPRVAPLSMGTSTPAGAVAVGEAFLTEQKELDSAGSAQLAGHVLDDKGVMWPAWMVRAGDTISFTDASDTSYRRIVRADYNHDARTTTIDLDSPPDGLQALLERLSVVLVPIGFS